MPTLNYSLYDGQQMAEMMYRRDMLLQERQGILDKARRLEERHGPAKLREGKTAAEWRAVANGPELTAKIAAAEEACRTRFAEWLVSTYPATE